MTTPTARAAGLPDLAIVVDSHERYAYTFSGKPAGLDVVDEGMPFTGVEAGWRLSRSAWGHG